MELTNFIYDFNLVTTKTANDVYESCVIINTGREKEIDYSNSVNLADLVRIFNDSYKRYLTDKDNLNRIVNKLGDKSYYFEHFTNKDFSLVTLEVINPFFNIFDEKKAFIRFIKRNGAYYAKAANGTNCFQMNYKEKVLALDNNDIKTSLEIVKKNNLFLKSVSDLSCKYIFGNGTTTIVSLIAGDVLEKLTTFTLSFGNSFLNSTDFIKIIFKLETILKFFMINLRLL